MENREEIIRINKQIVEEYKKYGTSRKELAKKFNRNPEQIARLLWNAGYNKFSYEELNKRNETIKAEYLSGISEEKLSKKYCISIVRIRKIVRGRIKKYISRKDKNIRRNEHIVNDYISGLNRKEIAKKYNLHVNTIGVILRHNRCGSRQKSVVLDRDSKVVHDFKNGMKLYEIAEKYRISNAQVGFILSKNGYKDRYRKMERNQQIVGDYISGISKDDIAVKYGLSKIRIRAILQKADKADYTYAKLFKRNQAIYADKHENNLSLNEIAQKYKLSKTYIVDILSTEQ